MISDRDPVFDSFWPKPKVHSLWKASLFEGFWMFHPLALRFCSRFDRKRGTGEDSFSRDYAGLREASIGGSVKPR